MPVSIDPRSEAATLLYSRVAETKSLECWACGMDVGGRCTFRAVPRCMRLAWVASTDLGASTPKRLQLTQTSPAHEISFESNICGQALSSICEAMEEHDASANALCFFQRDEIPGNITMAPAQWNLIPRPGPASYESNPAFTVNTANETETHDRDRTDCPNMHEANASGIDTTSNLLRSPAPEAGQRH
jgi:hypothetical protein